VSAAEASQINIYLASFLEPLAPFLERDDVSDIYINKPFELWAETLGGKIERHELPSLDERLLLALSRQIAAFSNQGISREHPLLSASLPNGARVQVIAPPATRGSAVLAIRKHIASDLSLTDYAKSGAFTTTRIGTRDNEKAANENIVKLLGEGDVAGALSFAVKARKTILVSGGTSTGKTTFLNSLMREIPAEERIVLIEDTPELQMHHDNMIGLLAARSALGEAEVTANDLVSASLRLRPDRIILGELRGNEAYAFLRAVNTGHPGSMTTVHADSPESAIEQIVLLVLQGGTRLSSSDVRNYVRAVVGLYVQLGRTAGRRVVEEVRLID
jgi:type IV secretion system protein VirB11